MSIVVPWILIIYFNCMGMGCTASDKTIYKTKQDCYYSLKHLRRNGQIFIAICYPKKLNKE